MVWISQQDSSTVGWYTSYTRNSRIDAVTDEQWRTWMGWSLGYDIKSNLYISYGNWAFVFWRSCLRFENLLRLACEDHQSNTSRWAHNWPLLLNLVKRKKYSALVQFDGDKVFEYIRFRHRGRSSKNWGYDSSTFSTPVIRNGSLELAVGSSEMGVLAPATWPFAMEMLPCIRSWCHLQHHQFLPMSTCHSRMTNWMNSWWKISKYHQWKVSKFQLIIYQRSKRTLLQPNWQPRTSN